jgi:membrane protein
MWKTIKATFEEWSEDKATRLAAALSFYTIFALAPLLVVIIAVAGFFYGEAAAQGQLMEQIRQYAGENGANAIQNLLVAARPSSSGLIAGILSLVSLLIVASGLFVELQSALDTIWEVEPRPGRSWRVMIRERFWSFLVVLGAGLLLLALMVASTVLNSMSDLIARVPFGEWIQAGVNFIAPVVLFTLIFALVYKYLPDVIVSWSDVLPGAFVTAILLTVGKYLIALYLSYSSVSSAFGAAGSLAMLLLWIYYSALIVFLGAEFTQVYARHRGHSLQPSSNAIPTTEEARAQQGIPHQPRMRQA